ncbi:hypothetical protein D7147_26070 [Micromonospora musae]|uniref:Uncharacterized protein n=1 Tax=Micromonospora musae TaxID=1894970 RepID=A0A3A9XZS6_9ACTN|nr:DUF5715 family protein [Micromonospora musae]RKN15319.1 hypothetical protein D7147_26070 [Micromonospora musae]RKN30681.1 hypothetical protein D7044_20060 [Micromonospora musae]
MRVPSRSPGGRPGPTVASTAPARRLPASSGPPPATDPDLVAYREAVADLLVEVGALADAPSTAARQVLIDERLREPALAAVLDATPQGLLGARETLLLEMARYQPNPRSSARDLTALVRIYLLSRIDVMWWRDVADFVTDDQVQGSPDLVDLEWLRRRDLLRFRYREQPATVVGRSWHALRRRLRPEATPRTAGLLARRARREVVALLNDLGREFAAATPPGTPPLWVTSLTRSVEHQHRLRRLGYAAMLPSGHCTGYAMDVEMTWYARYGVQETLAALLLTRQQAGEINVIDEGQAWHVCLAPVAGRRLRRAYEAEMGV